MSYLRWSYCSLVTLSHHWYIKCSNQCEGEGEGCYCSAVVSKVDMGYKSSIVIFLDFTSGFFTPVPPLLRDFEKFFFKVASNIKLNTLITNIIISKFKNVILKNETIFSYIWILGSKTDFWRSSHIDYSLEGLEKSLSDANFQALSESGWIKMTWNARLLLTAKYDYNSDRINVGIPLSRAPYALNILEPKWDYTCSMQFFILYPNMPLDW